MNSVTIEARNIDFAYGNGPVLRDLSLRIEAGELFAVLGPIRLGQDLPAAIDCRSRAPPSRHHPHQQDRCIRRPADAAQNRHGISEPCPVAAHDGLREHRLRRQRADIQPGQA